jgi:hypothetical protein
MCKYSKMFIYKYTQRNHLIPFSRDISLTFLCACNAFYDWWLPLIYKPAFLKNIPNVYNCKCVYKRYQRRAAKKRLQIIFFRSLISALYSADHHLYCWWLWLPNQQWHFLFSLSHNCVCSFTLLSSIDYNTRGLSKMHVKRLHNFSCLVWWWSKNKLVATS